MRIMRRSFSCGTLIFALAGPLSVSGQTGPLSVQVESGMVKLSDSDVEYFSQGQGEAIILLPGANLSVGYLDGLAEALADAGYRVVRINFRGAGKSVGAEAGVTLHTLAADTAGVIEALKLGPSNIVGHAFGNRVARQLAADRPDLVRTVILLAAGGKVDPQPAAAAALRTFFNPASSDAAGVEAMRYMVGNPAEAEMAWQVIKPSLAPNAWAIEYKAAIATPLQDWWAPSGTAKYLVVQGSNDQVAPPKNGELLKQDLGARVTLALLPDAGHLMLVTDPKKVAESIASFLHQ